MARASIDVIGDSASAQRALEQTAVAVDATGDAFKKLAVDAEASARAMISASTSRVARLQQEASAAKSLSATYVAGSEEQAVAAELAAKRTAQANRLLGASIASQGSMLSAAGRAGRGLTTYVTAPTAFIGYEAIKQAVDFNQQMLLLKTQAGDATDSIQALSSQVLDLTKVAPQGPAVLAQGLFHLVSLGLRGSEAMNTLRVASIAAGMGIANIEDTTSALGAAVVSGIKGANDYQQAMATLVATAGIGNMRFGDLAAAVGNVLPAAAAGGVSLQEMGAALAVLTDRGMNADEAATRLRMSLSLIQRPSAAASKALNDMGVDANSLGAQLRQPGGLLVVLRTLHDAIGRVGVVRGNRDLLAAFGGARSGIGIQTLVQSLDSSISSYQGKLAQLGVQTKQVGENTQAYLESPAYKLHNALAQVQADMVKLGQSLTPAITATAGTIAKIADGFNALPGPIRQDVGVVVGLLAVAGPLMLAIKGVVAAVGGMADMFRMLPLAAGPAIAATDTEVASIGASAVAAGAEVSALRLGLLSLSGLAIAPIVIPIIIKTGLAGDLKNAAKGHPNIGKTIADDFNTALGVASYVVPFSGLRPRRGKSQGSQTSDVATNAITFPLQSPFANVDTSKLPQPFADAAARYRREHSTDTGPGSISTFTLPQNLANQLSKAQAGYGSLTKAETDIRTYVLNLVHSGRLRGKAIQQAYDELASVNTKAAGGAKSAAAAAKRAVTNDQLLAQARLDISTGDTAAANQLLEKDRARLQEELKQAKNGDMRLTITKQLTTVENLLKSKQASFALSLSMQEQQARANAIATLSTGTTPLQLKLAEQAKSAAMKAINSHTLTMQGLIDAWNVVGQANQTIAQSINLANSYHAVSTRALTAGLSLSRDARGLLEERLAQAEAHRGYAPNGPAAQGQIIIDTVHVHGVQDVNGLIDQIQGHTRIRSQRRGGRRR